MVWRIINHPISTGIIAVLISRFLSDITGRDMSVIMQFLYDYLWQGIWPIWVGLAVFFIHWCLNFSIKVHRAYKNYERDRKEMVDCYELNKKEMVDKINTYQNAVISLSKQFTNIDNRLDKIEANLKSIALR